MQAQVACTAAPQPQAAGESRPPPGRATAKRAGKAKRGKRGAKGKAGKEVAFAGALLLSGLGGAAGVYNGEFTACQGLARSGVAVWRRPAGGAGQGPMYIYRDDAGTGGALGCETRGVRE